MSPGKPKQPGRDYGQWGGDRQGSGRTPHLEGGQAVSVALTEDERLYLRQRGDGNVSAGVRALLACSPAAINEDASTVPRANRRVSVVYLPGSDVERLRAIGNGKVTSGLRRLIAHARITPA